MNRPETYNHRANNRPSPKSDEQSVAPDQRSGEDWKRSIRAASRSPGSLLKATGGHKQATSLAEAHESFPVLVPPAFLERIHIGDPNDPLLRQVMPREEEIKRVPGYVKDPVGDLNARSAPGVIHKYHGRALLIATGACAIHCRYCFRRHFPYAEETAARDHWQGALTYLANDTSLSEVILSGGDPLLLDTPRLQRLTDGLRGLPHIKRLRIHSRIPVVLPERIDSPLLDWLDRIGLQKILVTHVNHANEFGPAAGNALSALRSVGVTLLNQAVLLKGVNDNESALIDLSEATMSFAVLPYYLNLLDAVEGAAHFEVSEDRARELMHQLRRRVSGYLVPRLVRERAGAPYKLPVL